MFALQGIDHVALTVRDVAASVRWYETVLGLERWTRHCSSGSENTEFMSASLRLIEASQKRWAAGTPRDPDKPTYARSVSDNLFLGKLTERSEAEFLQADGAELRDTAKRPAKMRALISSSALAVNFFDAWRGLEVGPLGVALGLTADVSGIRFEYVCQAYPVGPRSPNLDLLISMADGTLVGVESKYSEPYQDVGRGARLSSKYFPKGTGLWATSGMPQAQKLAADLGPRWEYLDAPQLLKHMLGLAHDGCAGALLYLWYDTGLADAATHREEIDRFAEAVKGERIAFLSRTYQETFLQLTSSPVPAWREYIEARYFKA